MVMDSVPPPNRPVSEIAIESLDSDGNTWIRKDGQWVPKMGTTTVNPDTPLTQEELDEMWCMSPMEFQEWKDQQSVKRQLQIFNEETRQDQQAKEAHEQRKAKKEARRSQNPLWGAFQ